MSSQVNGPPIHWSSNNSNNNSPSFDNQQLFETNDPHQHPPTNGGGGTTNTNTNTNANTTTAQTLVSSHIAEAARVVMYGRLLLVAMLLWFVLACWAVMLSKMMPTTGHVLLDSIAHDWYAPLSLLSFTTTIHVILSISSGVCDVRYYSLLVPLSIPATFIAIYLNWLGLKLFRHN
jgi:hypothetical protein